MANALADVEATYLSIDKNYNLLRAACTNDDERNALAAQYAAAQEAYQTVLGKFLDDDDAEIAALRGQLQDANVLVGQAVSQMGQISAVINNITQAVTIGASLVARFQDLD